jgi:hypothetical protein
MLPSDERLVPIGKESLTLEQYRQLEDFPAELEWLANITNPKTCRAYKIDATEFSAFTGLREPTQLRSVTRAHVIAWHKALEAYSLTPASIRRKLSPDPLYTTISLSVMPCWAIPWMA